MAQSILFGGRRARTGGQRARTLLILAALAAPTGAWAQSQTGTGGGPTSTVTAPNASSVGRVMPRPGAGGVGADAQLDRTDRTPQMKADDKIQKGICIGCGAK
ncbi:hypothetical protein [Methylobacterium gregans]|uniref:Uncharacterized protein n=1 Tax=Methylobacterium gregans TaxID=374424 RepID=A0AA37HJU9_9HYPH|nr:hypothetical protein [Methylobacterium gregans]MDQ0520018.1 hypothetical protein [Methylobacterium gregans]GJD77037.1 hypothetical protein NBEOAGPD_0239 [Methylobacterium gregans]GLS52414.1 hypothetical protein GCM10007886_05970 [Methylobacterium gregans]